MKNGGHFAFWPGGTSKQFSKILKKILYFIFIFGTLSTPCHLKLPTLIFSRRHATTQIARRILLIASLIDIYRICQISNITRTCMVTATTLVDRKCPCLQMQVRGAYVLPTQLVRNVTCHACCNDAETELRSSICNVLSIERIIETVLRCIWSKATFLR